MSLISRARNEDSLKYSIQVKKLMGNQLDTLPTLTNRHLPVVELSGALALDLQVSAYCSLAVVHMPFRNKKY
jgi:hypothetical protein